MQVSLKYPEEHLADLAEAAYGGEAIEIAAPDKPTLKLTISKTLDGVRVLGAGIGRIPPISFEEWQAMDSEIKSIAGKAPLVTSGEI